VSTEHANSTTTPAHGDGVPDLLARDRAVIAGVEKLRFFPLAAVSGSGHTLVEPDGRELIDLSASWTASGFGHGNMRIAAVIADAAASSPGSSILSATHPDAVSLAEELLDLVPSSLPPEERRVYLGHAGTDANEVALHGARHATGRPNVIAFENGYHGGMGDSRGVSGVHIASGVPADPHLTLLPYPDAYRPHTGDASTIVEDILAAASEELSRGKTAAVIVEPIQSDGGVIVPPAGFLSGLRELCDAHGAYLIVDEVKVGLGRTGLPHAFAYDGVVPDIVTLGKALGGGLPLSAAVGPASVLDEPVASALMTTTGNPISCAAGRAVLSIVREGSVTANARDRGFQLLTLFEEYVRTYRPGACHVGNVRGRGLSVGVEIVHDRQSAAADDNLTAKIVYRAWQLGVVAYPVRGNVIELTPPLTIPADALSEAVRLLTQAIDDAAEGVVSDEQIADYQGW